MLDALSRNSDIGLDSAAFAIRPSLPFFTSLAAFLVHFTLAVCSAFWT